MSEPMSAGEIEDVLSSIRRLVSEELRPIARAPKAEPDTKLILTPALRVVSNAGAEPKIVDDIGDAVVIVADAIDTTTEFEGENGDPAPVTDGAPMAWPEDPDDEGDVTQIDRFVFQSRQSGLAVPPVLTDEPDEPIVTECVAPGALVYSGEVLDAHYGTLDPVEAWAQVGPAEADDLVAIPMPEAGQDDLDQAWVDQAEAEVMAALSVQADDLGAESQAQDRKAPEDPSIFAEELRFDEAVLRDLVRDLIRQELQGSLGERITRNVRKLVRVEVARALSLHDLE